MAKVYSKGDVSVSKGMDPLKNRTFQLRTTEIIALDNMAHDLKLSKSVMVRRALKDKYGINALHATCEVDFDINKQ